MDYLPKPIDPDILIGKVKVFLQLEEQRLELEEVSKELRWISRKNKLLLDSAGEGIAGIDVDGLITFINPVACEMLGGTEEAFQGQHVSKFIFEADGEAAIEKWKNSEIRSKCLEEGGEYTTDERMLWTLSGETFPAQYHMTAIANEKQKVQGAVLLFQDITERKNLEEQLTQMAKYDSLTGLANRTLFKEFLHASLARSERRSKNNWCHVPGPGSLQGNKRHPGS